MPLHAFRLMRLMRPAVSAPPPPMPTDVPEAGTSDQGAANRGAGFILKQTAGLSVSRCQPRGWLAGDSAHEGRLVVALLMGLAGS